jgi:hypothetical protein
MERIRAQRANVRTGQAQVLQGNREKAGRRAGGIHLVPGLLLVLLRGRSGLLNVFVKLRGSHGRGDDLSSLFKLPRFK